MSQRVIRYEGDGKRRRPIYADEGPASAAIQRQIGEGKTSLLDGLPSRELGGAGPIERTYLSAAERAERVVAIPVGPSAAERMQASRQRGAQRHVELVAAAKTSPRPLAPVLAVAPDPPAPAIEEETVIEAAPPATVEVVVESTTDYSDPITAAPPSDLGHLLERVAQAANHAAWTWSQSIAAAEAAVLADASWREARDRLLAALEAAGMAQASSPPPAQALAYGEQPFAFRSIVGGGVGPAVAIADQVREAERRHEQLLVDPLPTTEAIAAAGQAFAQAALEEARASIALDGETQVVETAPADPTRPVLSGRRTARVEGGLTLHEQRILDAVLEHDGARKPVATQLKTSDANIVATLERIGKRGLLPIELIPLLPARFAKYTGV